MLPEYPVTGKYLEQPLADSDTSSQDSSSFSSDNSDEVDAKEVEQAKILNEALTTMLASGGSECPQIHLLQANNTDTEHVLCLCKRRLRRQTCILKAAVNLPCLHRRPCPACSEFWPPALKDWYAIK